VNFLKVCVNTDKVIQTKSTPFNPVDRDEENFNYLSAESNDIHAGDTFDGTTHTPFQPDIDWNARREAWNTATLSWVENGLDEDAQWKRCLKSRDIKLMTEDCWTALLAYINP
jgi:hypothetical protein